MQYKQIQDLIPKFQKIDVKRTFAVSYLQYLKTKLP